MAGEERKAATKAGIERKREMKGFANGESGVGGARQRRIT